MADLAAIRARLASMAPDDFTAYPIIVEAPDLPAICVGNPDVTYGQTMRRSRFELPLIVVFPTSDLEDAQARISALVSGAGSLQALYTNPTTDAPYPWDSCQLVSVDNYRTVSIGDGGTGLAVDFNLSITA